MRKKTKSIEPMQTDVPDIGSEATQNTPNGMLEAVSFENLIDEPEAVTTEDTVNALDTIAETDNNQDAVNEPDKTLEISGTVDIPFSRLSKTGRYITLLEMYDGDYPKVSKMNEFLACLRPLVFELQLYENIKDKKELRDTVLLPGGAKGYTALQASIKHLEARVNELYEGIFKDELTDGATANNEMLPTL